MLGFGLTFLFFTKNRDQTVIVSTAADPWESQTPILNN